MRRGRPQTRVDIGIGVLWSVRKALLGFYKALRGFDWGWYGMDIDKGLLFSAGVSSDVLHSKVFVFSVSSPAWGTRFGLYDVGCPAVVAWGFRLKIVFCWGW